MAKRQKPDPLKDFKDDDQRRRTAIWQETCQVVRDLGRYACLAYIATIKGDAIPVTALLNYFQ